MAASQTVGFIGLGRMGSGIARNIQKAGFGLVVYNRTPEKTRPFEASGVTAAQTPRQAAAGADFVVTSLMDDRSVFDVVTGNDSILAGSAPTQFILALRLSRRASVRVSPSCMRSRAP